jgi:hypothetical protein
MLSRATITIVSLLALVPSADLPRAYAEDAARIDERSRKSMLEYLRTALKSDRGASRLYYAGCWPGGFPRLNLQPPTNEKKGLAAVRQIFKKNKDVTVAQDASGIVRISVGKVPTEILQTRIRSLWLKPEEQYTPGMALIAISGAKEVEAAMKRLGLEHPVIVASILVQEPMPGLVHLPRTISNVTLDQAYDSVAKTFDGLVIYSVCEGPDRPRTFDADFACFVCESH